MKNRSRVIHNILLGILIQTSFIHAQFVTKPEGHWRQVAPGMSGSNRAVYADKVNPNKIWLAPDMGNDYVSLDAGKHWETRIPFNSVWSQRKTLSDECVMSDHKNNKIVINLRKKDIEYSTDGGYTFTKITSYASGQEPNSVWYTACPHPTQNGTWYVANGLDNKELKTGVTPNPLNDIDQNQPKVWKITNLTNSSRKITAIPNAGMNKATAVFDVFCHPNTTKYPNMLFAATSTGFYRKSNTSNWVKIYNGPTKADYNWNGSTLTVYVLRMANYTITGNNLNSYGGVYKTTNPETASTTSGWQNKTATLLLNLNKIQVTNNLFRSMVKRWFGYTNGEEASVVKPNSFLQNFTDILVDPKNPNKAYLSVWGGFENKPIIGAIWATSNGGNNWFSALRLGVGYNEDSAYWNTKQAGKINRNVELQVHDRKFPNTVKYGKRGVRSMAISANGTLYAAAVKGYYTVRYNSNNDIWRSVDNTVEGKTYYGHGNANTGAFAVVPNIHKAGEMFLLPYELSAWKSTTKTKSDFPGIVGVERIPALIDNGKSWAPGQPFNTPTTIASHPTNASVFYAMSSRTGKFMKISQNGTKLENISEPIDVPETINVGDMKVVYWTDLTIAPDGKTMYAVAEIIDTDNRPMGQTRIFNPASRKGVYKSTNEGKTWTCINNNLPKVANGRKSGILYGTNGAAVKSLIMDPSNANMLYAAIRRYRAPKGTNGWVNGGFYLTKNGGSNWTKIAIPSGIKSVWDVWVHTTNKTGKKIYVAGGGEGDKATWGEGGIWSATYKANGNYVSSDWTKIFGQPFVSHIRTSPFNGNYLLAVTRETTQKNKKDAGIYYSINGGANWTKFNEGRSSMMVGDICFDNGKSNRVWAACEMSGIYTALLPIGTEAPPTNDTPATDNVEFVYPNPAPKTPNTSYTYKIAYSATIARDVAVAIFDGNQFIASSSPVRVQKGSGRVNITVNLTNNLVAGKNYEIRAIIREAGGNYTTNKKVVKISQKIQATTAKSLSTEINGVTPPAKMIAYPNPMGPNNILNLTINNSKASQIECFSLEGKTIYSNTIKASELSKGIISIDCSNFNSNLFFIKIINNNGIESTIKIIR